MAEACDSGAKQYDSPKYGNLFSHPALYRGRYPHYADEAGKDSDKDRERTSQQQ